MLTRKSPSSHRPRVRAGLMFLALGALSLSGCVSLEPDTIYDRTPRPPTENVRVVRGDLERPYTIIAKLNAKADTHVGGTPLGELIKKAQQLGADALLLNPPRTVWTTSTVSGRGISADGGPEMHVDARSEKYVLAGWAVAFKKE